jgi:general secretion pathway protein D
MLKWFGVCLLLAGFATFVPVSSPAGPGTQKISLDFKEIELPALIQTISELTGKNFIYDDSVKGKITVSSPVELTIDEVYNLFLAVLSTKGYTVVPSGKIHKVVPIKAAKESSLPFATKRTPGEQYVTRLIQLQNVNATLMATTVLGPLVPKNSNIVAYAPSNTLIITDSAANIKRLLNIVRELDIASTMDRLEIIPLTYASAEEVAKICAQVISQVATTPKRGRAAKNVQTAGRSNTGKIIPYGPTNSLIIMAAVDDIETVKHLVGVLDRKPSQDRSNIQVYYLENADAETLGKTLNEILTGVAAKPQTDNKARRQQPLIGASVTITADKPTNSLIINALPEDYEVIKGIIGQLDIKRKQVFVEALILELSMDATQKLGVSLQGAIETGSDSIIYAATGPSAASNLLIDSDTGVTSILTAAIDGIKMGGLFNPITITDPTDSSNTITIPAISALINISKTNTDVNILSAPRLLTSDNEEAEIIVGSNIPVITSRLTDTGGGSNLAQSVTVERQDVALTLRFTPQITQGDRVRLTVFQETTGLVSTDKDIGPTLTKRLVRNTVLADNGHTVVLGGIIRNDRTESISKVPILGDIPILGWLFKTKRMIDKKTNLLVFITPRIIKDTEDLAAVTRKSKSAMDNFKTGQLPGIEPFCEPTPIFEGAPQ